MHTYHLLLIDDQPEDAHRVKTLLATDQTFPCLLLTSPSVEQGIKRCRQLAFDALLLAVNDHPDIEHVQVFSQQFPDLPIVVLTRNSDEQLGLATIQAGAEDYLLKTHLDTPILIRTLRYAIERLRTRTALKKRNQVLETVNQLARAIASTLDLEQILATVVEQTAQALNVTSAYLCDWDGENTAIKVMARHISPLSHPAEQSLDISRVYYLEESFVNSPRWLQNPAQVWVMQTDDPQVPPSMLERYERYDVQSVLGAVLKNNDQIIGYLALWETRHQRQFTEDEISLLRAIADQVAATIYNARLYAALQASERLNRQMLVENRQYSHKLAELVDVRTAQLRQINERMSAILHNTSDAILLLDDDGRIRNNNRAFDDLFGYYIDEAYGQPLASIALPPFDQQLAHLFTEVMQHQQSRRVQIKARRKHNEAFDADLTLSPITDIDSPLHGAICSLRDITEMKEVERLKDSFIHMVSHELRNPLASLLAGAENLQVYYVKMGEEKRLQAIERISKQADKMRHLIDNIMEIAIPPEREAVPRVPVEMESLLTLVLEELTPLAERNQLALMTTFHRPLPPIKAIPMHFTRIWDNLIGNAIKYTPAGGTITVRVGILTKTETLMTEGVEIEPDTLPEQLASGQYLVGQVADTGKGIPPEDMKQLFTLFFRGSARYSQVQGTGLGLAMVRQLLHRYHGDIIVHSEINKGSSFTFWIPVQ